MSYIKKKRDRRNYDMVKFFTTPPKLIMPKDANLVEWQVPPTALNISLRPGPI